MKKHPELLRRSKLLTNHAGYCSARAIIAQLTRVYASEVCMFGCEVCVFVLLRLRWQAGRCKRRGASNKLA